MAKAQASAVEQDKTPGGVKSIARRSHNIRLELAPEPEIEIELTDSEPSIQQHQAYEQFWRLFLERVLTKRQQDEND